MYCILLENLTDDTILHSCMLQNFDHFPLFDKTLRHMECTCLISSSSVLPLSNTFFPLSMHFIFLFIPSCFHPLPFFLLPLPTCFFSSFSVLPAYSTLFPLFIHFIFLYLRTVLACIVQTSSIHKVLY